jgi:hypothetical protein
MIPQSSHIQVSYMYIYLQHAVFNSAVLTAEINNVIFQHPMALHRSDGTETRKVEINVLLKKKL